MCADPGVVVAAAAAAAVAAPGALSCGAAAAQTCPDTLKNRCDDWLKKEDTFVSSCLGKQRCIIPVERNYVGIDAVEKTCWSLDR